MKLKEECEKIFLEYDLKKIELPDNYANLYEYLDDFPDEKVNFENNKEGEFFKKYSKHIPQGWYGFSIGSPIIPKWLDVIEEILDLCIENDPDFGIHQIKIKFGGIRFYVYSEVIEDIFDIEILIEQTLFDKNLIY